jgi:hypothetical protein
MNRRTTRLLGVRLEKDVYDRLQAFEFKTRISKASLAKLLLIAALDHYEATQIVPQLPFKITFVGADEWRRTRLSKTAQNIRDPEFQNAVKGIGKLARHYGMEAFLAMIHSAALAGQKQLPPARKKLS